MRIHILERSHTNANFVRKDFRKKITLFVINVYFVCLLTLGTVGFYLKFFLFALRENSSRPPPSPPLFSSSKPSGFVITPSPRLYFPQVKPQVKKTCVISHRFKESDTNSLKLAQMHSISCRLSQSFTDSHLS